MFFLQFPTSTEEWLTIADQFDNRCQFPNCGGAIDGQHIRINQPPHSCSMYYNYKGYFSVVLMAVVNANYKFMFVDVGRMAVLQIVDPSRKQHSTRDY